MQSLSYPTRKYIILHGHPDAPYALVTYDPPSKISTGQPNVEAFDDPQAAIDKAIEIGVPPLLTQEFWPHDQAFDATTGKLVPLPSPIPEWASGTTYQPGSVVRHTITKEGEGETFSQELTFLAIKATTAEPTISEDDPNWTPFVVKEPPGPVVTPPTPPPTTPEPDEETQTAITDLQVRIGELEKEVEQATLALQETQSELTQTQERVAVVEAAVGPPAWKQPTGAHDAYAIDAEVSHANPNRPDVSVWKSLIAANTTIPGDDGVPPDGPWYDRYWAPVR
jgi:hypothetical protein